MNSGQTDRARAAIVPAPAPAAVPAPRRIGVEPVLYLALAIMVAMVSLAASPWLGPVLVAANPVVWAATVVVAVFMLVEAGSIVPRALAWCFAATLLLGPTCGLSLFLRASRRAGRRSR